MTAPAFSTLAPTPALAPTLPRLAEATAAVAPRATATASSAVAVSTLPVFVPGFEPDQWSLLRGSIVGSATGSPAETTVTIFCDDQSTLSCQLDNLLPFVVTEGPSSLHYAESLPGTLTVAIDCALDNTTAATCTVYSSYASGYGQASAFETKWYGTLTAPNVEWGVLTLSEPAAASAPSSPKTSSASSLLSPRGTRAGRRGQLSLYAVSWATIVVLATCLTIL